MLIFNNLPTAFPWYDKKEKQERYKENVSKVCDYKLITPNDALLPFQFFRLANESIPFTWKIHEANTDAIVVDVTNSLGTLLKRKTLEGNDYFYYAGNGLIGVTDGPITPLPYGFYYAKIVFDDDTVFWSEMFHVPADGFSFLPLLSGNFSGMNYIRLQFWNNCDLQPIFYNDLSLGQSIFKQTVYLDTIVTASEPEIQVDGTKDGNDVLIPTFQRVSIKYRISDVVSDFLKVALSLLPLHQNIGLVLQKGINKGDIEKISVQSSLEANGALSLVEILFEQDLAIVKAGCCDNMTEGGAGPSDDALLMEDGSFRLLEDGSYRLLES